MMYEQELGPGDTRENDVTMRMETCEFKGCNKTFTFNTVTE